MVPYAEGWEGLTNDFRIVDGQALSLAVRSGGMAGEERPPYSRNVSNSEL